MWQRFKNFYHFLRAAAAAVFFNFPSKKLTVVGVTGTDGKTTTVNMIYHILKAAHGKVSVISSVNAQIGPKSFDTGFHVTTPDPWQVQKYLREAVDSGSDYFVLEATSHGLDQNRLAFVDFKVAVLTNITHEHIDYHGTWQNYAAAKGKLFENVKFSILNRNDQKSYLFLKDKVSGQLVTYSAKNQAEINLKNFPIELKIPGFYNLENALASAAACWVLGIDKKLILKALANFPGVVGRLEEVDLGQDFKVIVDFAHTPNGLENALKTLRSQISPSARLIVVFGAAGERDRTKRPLMGKIAGRYADIIVLTAEDPRSENVEDICRQIAQGIRNKKKGKDYLIILDRAQAIEYAINLAKKNDLVATFGKSHEQSMCYGKTEYPWDEFAVVRGVVKKKLKWSKNKN